METVIGERPHPATSSLMAAYLRVRAVTNALAAPLSAEDQNVQSMPDVSPTKWHLAHTTWFFENLVLKDMGHKPFDDRYAYLFNSYYEALGPRHSRPHRGLLTRPSTEEIREYRNYVDDAMRTLCETLDPTSKMAAELTLGLHHEQQHQELILTDIKHALFSNPILPSYLPPRPHEIRSAPPMRWIDFEGGLVEIGYAGDAFAFDNEKPRHKTFLNPYRLASRLVTNGEYRAFMDDGGYQRPEFWLSDGWVTCRNEGWNSPLYWFEENDRWKIFTLRGAVPLNDAEPVAHVSSYEAVAFAAWAGKRLPSEAEWENAGRDRPAIGNFQDTGCFHPIAASDSAGLTQMFGDVWEWTRSSYDPYPGYRPYSGALAEYNGKFMSGQLVLRGGSCATPRDHIRPTYRNFFPPAARWQFSGIRLADDL
jgi:ergothioneine biosynthesis protein EgtB